MAVHVMWDLETFGLRSARKIPIPSAIGAVKFDGTTILDKFRVGIDPVDAERYGLTVSASTFVWWLDPKRADARAAWLDLPKVPLDAALIGLMEWIREVPLEDLGSSFGKGSTFDNVLLKDYCELAQVEYLFSYRQDECYRTLANRNPDIKYEQLGIAHDPLDDAMSQAVHTQRLAAAGRIEL